MQGSTDIPALNAYDVETRKAVESMLVKHKSGITLYVAKCTKNDGCKSIQNMYIMYINIFLTCINFIYWNALYIWDGQSLVLWYIKSLNVTLKKNNNLPLLGKIYTLTHCFTANAYFQFVLDDSTCMPGVLFSSGQVHVSRCYLMFLYHCKAFQNHISVEYHDAFFNFIIVILLWAMRRLKIF